MTAEQARAISERWGNPGPRPAPGWRCCMRCGDYWAPDGRFWCDPGKRLCQACKNDEKRGIWPYRRTWHKKNRWTTEGKLVRRCCLCRRWKPLTHYYVMHRRDTKARTHRMDPWAVCIDCGIARKGYRSSADMRRELRNARKTEREQARAA